MTVISLYGGPLKRDVIQLAFEECGQAGYEFELTPEEYDSALRRMNTLLAEWRDGLGIDLGYNFPPYGNGNGDDESGLPDGAVNAVATHLALRIAPSIGKTMPPEAKQAMSGAMSILRAKYQTTPTRELGRQTMRGQGNRFWNGPRPYFATPLSPDEVAQ